MKLWFSKKEYPIIAEWSMYIFTYQLRNDGKIRYCCGASEWSKFRRREVESVLSTINNSDYIYLEMHGFAKKQPSQSSNRSMLKRMYYDTMDRIV